MTANISTKTYTCESCGKVSNNAGNHGRHVAAHKAVRPEKVEWTVERPTVPVEAPRSTWGGTRPGSGRKPKLVGIRTRCFILDEQADARFERFRHENGLVGDQDASEALRRIIAIAVPESSQT